MAKLDTIFSNLLVFGFFGGMLYLGWFYPIFWWLLGLFVVYMSYYISAGGYSSFAVDIELNLPNLENLIAYLNGVLAYRNSVEGQRTLMTTKLREAIKARDNHTCRHCGISTHKEPHLLLEIDHIIPVSKGGQTMESNLQTLCWKCNRTKGAKLYT